MARVSICLALCVVYLSVAERTFTIDYDHDLFLKDGEMFRVISGALHYFMIPPPYWYDRVLKTRALGMNTIQAYVSWNFHEFYPGKFKWDGWSNLTGFLDIINSLDMLVSLRPGPYIDANVDFGGLPWWLLKYKNIQSRTSDSRYLTAVTNWFDELLPKVRPYLYVNGGPIISVQVENEYGSYYACDRGYMTFLRDLMRSHLGSEVLLYTTDGNTVDYLRCGVVPSVYPTVDFGPATKAEVLASYKAQKSAAPRGPFVNSEFYPGWQDEWGKPHSTGDVGKFLATLDYIWALNGSFSIFLSAGGTLFGYTASAESSGPNDFATITTSYDYDAPINEAGDITHKFTAIRSHLEQLRGHPNPFPIPLDSRKSAYGAVEMKKIGNVLELLEKLCPHKLVHHTEFPMNVEWLNFPFGFVLYETTTRVSGTVVQIPGVKDRAYVMVNGVLKAILQRPVLNSTLRLDLISIGDKIDILVENQGRVDYGSYINDTKGLLGNVTLNGHILVKWDIYPLDINRLFDQPAPVVKPVRTNNSRKLPFVPSFYLGPFATADMTDTFLDTTGWGKGQAVLNGVNLGRYWSVGPTYTMYTPKPFLTNHNRLIMFELEQPGNCHSSDQRCQVHFVDKPIRMTSATAP